MAETYDITFEAAPIGTARMEKQGLYYRFVCRCRLPEEGLYRIHVILGDKREDLGICVPVDGAFGMDKMISAKRLGEGTPAFELVIRDWQPPEQKKEPEEAPAEEIIQAAEALTAEAPKPNEENQGEENTETVETDREIFVPVTEEEPFDYLDRLEDAVMEVREDAVGILLSEKQ